MPALLPPPRPPLPLPLPLRCRAQPASLRRVHPQRHRRHGDVRRPRRAASARRRRVAALARRRKRRLIALDRLRRLAAGGAAGVPRHRTPNVLAEGRHLPAFPPHRPAAGGRRTQQRRHNVTLAAVLASLVSKREMHDTVQYNHRWIIRTLVILVNFCRSCLVFVRTI